jgi:hypothetical protein
MSKSDFCCQMDVFFKKIKNEECQNQCILDAVDDDGLMMLMLMLYRPFGGDTMLMLMLMALPMVCLLGLCHQ